MKGAYMATCIEQLYIDLAACDAQWQIDKAACNGDPQCLQQAVFKRQACEDAAFRKYDNCVIGGGGTSLAAPAEGAPDCGCG